MTQTEFDALVQKHFGSRYKGIILLERDITTEACIIHEICGVRVVFTWFNETNDIFDIKYGGGFSGPYFVSYWQTFEKEFKGE